MSKKIKLEVLDSVGVCVGATTMETSGVGGKGRNRLYLTDEGKVIAVIKVFSNGDKITNIEFDNYLK